MHITYRYETDLKHIDLQSMGADPKPAAIMELVQRRKNDLQNEEKEIRRICVTLWSFIAANSIVPFNDDLVDYMQLFLDEEKSKGRSGNPDIIHNLQRVIDEYKAELSLYTRSTSSTNDREFVDPRKIDEIFTLVGQLFRLPINGQFIREQVEGIKRGKLHYVDRNEQDVPLPVNLNDSKVLADIEALLH